jgi:hypothetical protein
MLRCFCRFFFLRGALDLIFAFSFRCMNLEKVEHNPDKLIQNAEHRKSKEIKKLKNASKHLNLPIEKGLCRSYKL